MQQTTRLVIEDELVNDRRPPLCINPSSSRNSRYDDAVEKEAQRLLPALSRSYFSASVNSEDVAAAEVRSLLDRAWLSSTSDLFDDPIKEVSGPDLGSSPGLAVAASTTSAGSPDVALNCGIAKIPVRPWHVAKDLLKMHVLACKVRGTNPIFQSLTGWQRGKEIKIWKRRTAMSAGRPHRFADDDAREAVSVMTSVCEL